MADFSHCSSGCTVGGHASWGECVRGKALRTNAHTEAQVNAWDAELHAYQAAVKKGIQPAGTTMKQVRDAERISDVLGKPYRADADVVVQA